MSTRARLHEVYVLQIYLHARKTCEMCGEWLLVEDFSGYGTQPCEECRLERQRSLGLWVRHKPESRLKT